MTYIIKTLRQNYVARYIFEQKERCKVKSLARKGLEEGLRSKIDQVRQLKNDIKELEKHLEAIMGHLNNKDEKEKVRSIIEWSIGKKREKIRSINNVIRRQWAMRKEY